MILKDLNSKILLFNVVIFAPPHCLVKSQFLSHSSLSHTVRKFNWWSYCLALCDEIFFFIISLYSTKLSITQSFATASSVKYSEILQNFSYSIQSLSKTSPCTARKASPISQKSIWLMTITQSSMPWKRSKMMENCQMSNSPPHLSRLVSHPTHCLWKV